MLGSASAGMALIMLTVTFMGLYGVSFREWSEPKFVFAGKIFLPSRQSMAISFCGLIIGAIGLGLSLRRRTFSWLSALGLGLMLLTMAVVVCCGSFVRA
jgi:hypothetical protein